MVVVSHCDPRRCIRARDARFPLGIWNSLNPFSGILSTFFLAWNCLFKDTNTSNTVKAVNLCTSPYDHRWCLFRCWNLSPCTLCKERACPRPMTCFHLLAASIMSCCPEVNSHERGDLHLHLQVARCQKVTRTTWKTCLEIESPQCFQVTFPDELDERTAKVDFSELAFLLSLVLWTCFFLFLIQHMM